MSHWEGIVPCGLEGREVASVETLLRRQGLPPAEPDALMRLAAAAMVSHFEEVFGVEARAPAVGDLTFARHVAEAEAGLGVEVARRGSGVV